MQSFGKKSHGSIRNKTISFAEAFLVMSRSVSKVFLLFFIEFPILLKEYLACDLQEKSLDFFSQD